MPDEVRSFVPKPETWLWDALDAANSGALVPWLPERFSLLAQALRKGDYSRPAAIVSTLGEKARLASVQIDGGADAKFALVYAREVPPDWRPGIQESLTYSSSVAGTDLIYDLTGEFLQGKARPFLADFRQLPLRVYAVLPFQMEQIDLAAQQQVEIAAESKSTDQFELPVRLRFLDGRGEPISAKLPYFMQLRHSESEVAESTYRHMGPRGESPTSFCAAVQPRTGRWTLTVRSLLTGEEATLPIDVARVAAARGTAKIVLTSDGLKTARAPSPVKPSSQPG